MVFAVVIGMQSVLQLALLVQIAIVAAGVGVLFATTPLAFFVVKWFGVLYLLYLAYIQWTTKTQSIDIPTEQPTKSIPKLILYGFIVNISNPKAIVFLLAVLPQFLDLSKPQWIQYVIMAVTMIMIDFDSHGWLYGIGSQSVKTIKITQTTKIYEPYFCRIV